MKLPRVRCREDLYILWPFDGSKLRRRATKADAGIFLQRLRGDLGDNKEGSKTCTRCRRRLKRFAFVRVDGEEHSDTKQWEMRDRCWGQCPMRLECAGGIAGTAGTTGLAG